MTPSPLAAVISLDAHRPTVSLPYVPAACSGEEGRRRGLAQRVAHSPAAVDLRAHPFVAGLVLVALALLLLTLIGGLP